MQEVRQRRENSNIPFILRVQMSNYGSHTLGTNMKEEAALNNPFQSSSSSPFYTHQFQREFLAAIPLKLQYQTLCLLARIGKILKPCLVNGKVKLARKMVPRKMNPENMITKNFTFLEGVGSRSVLINRLHNNPDLFSRLFRQFLFAHLSHVSCS